MKREHGTPQQVVRNLVRSRRPLPERLLMAIGNGLRRLGPPPRECCGNLGEPGC